MLLSFETDDEVVDVNGGDCDDDVVVDAADGCGIGVVDALAVVVFDT